MKKNCLVVFYSRSGVTQKIADMIAAARNCDTEQILDLTPRSGFAGYCRSGYEAMTKKHPQIQPPQKNPGDYTLTIIGTPVWGGNIAAPMRTYLAQNRRHLNNIASFCTMGGSGGTKVSDDIATLCKKIPLANMALTDREIAEGSYQEKISQFLRTLSGTELNNAKIPAMHRVS